MDSRQYIAPLLQISGGRPGERPVAGRQGVWINRVAQTVRAQSDQERVLEAIWYPVPPRLKDLRLGQARSSGRTVNIASLVFGELVEPRFEMRPDSFAPGGRTIMRRRPRRERLAKSVDKAQRCDYYSPITSGLSCSDILDATPGGQECHEEDD